LNNASHRVRSITQVMSTDKSEWDTCTEKKFYLYIKYLNENYKVLKS